MLIPICLTPQSGGPGGPGGPDPFVLFMEPFNTKEEQIEREDEFVMLKCPSLQRTALFSHRIRLLFAERVTLSLLKGTKIINSGHLSIL